MSNESFVLAPQEVPGDSYRDLLAAVLALGLNQTEIAQETQLPKRTVSDLLRGRTSKPTEKTLRRLRSLLDNAKSKPKVDFEIDVPEFESSSLSEASTVEIAGGSKVNLHGSEPLLDVLEGSASHGLGAEPDKDMDNQIQNKGTRWSKLPDDHEPNQEIFIPVHGFVWLSDSEFKVINHAAFQRLRRVRQLGMAHYVYPGATHTRYEHVLGVLHLTARVIDSIASNHHRAKTKNQLRDPSDTSRWGVPLNAIEAAYCRLAALLHDIGHVPFGHSIEDELCLLNHHDEEDRLRLIMETWLPPGAIGPKLTELIDQAYLPDKPFLLQSIQKAVSPSEVVMSLILHEPVRRVGNEYKRYLDGDQQECSDRWVDKPSVIKQYSQDLALCGIRMHVCSDIVGNTICADLLDYLHRDWHHVGKARFVDDRILHYMEIRWDPQSAAELQLADVDPADRFVLNLGRYPSRLLKRSPVALCV